MQYTTDASGHGQDLVLVRNGDGAVYGSEGGSGGVVLQYWICDLSVGKCPCPSRPNNGGNLDIGHMFLIILFSTSSVYGALL
jgi:hypothetical protein